MDATALLRKDHETLRRLFDQLAAAGDDIQYKRVILRSIRGELEAHSRVEEEVFYPAVMRLRSSQAKEIVRAALEEHQALDGLLAEIDQMEPEDTRFEARVQALQQRVERHVAAEEGALFAQARIHLTDERLETLGRAMEVLKQESAAAGVADVRSLTNEPEPTTASGSARRAARGR